MTKKAKGLPQHIDHEKLRKRDSALRSMRESMGIKKLEETIREEVVRAWSASGHKAEIACALLDISRSRLYRMLDRYGIDRWD